METVLSRQALVTEDTENYYVQINYDDRFRAKSIPGRTWDHKIKKWVWSKTLENYISLQNEFKNDEFLISPPDLKVTSINDARDLSQNIYEEYAQAIRGTDFKNQDSVDALNQKIDSISNREQNHEIKKLFEDTKFKELMSEIKNMDEAKIQIATLTLELKNANSYVEEYHKTLRENEGLSDLVERKERAIQKKELHLESLKQKHQENAIELVSQAFEQATKVINFRQQRVVQIAQHVFSDDRELLESLDKGDLHMFCSRLHNQIYALLRRFLIDFTTRDRTKSEADQLQSEMRKDLKMKDAYLEVLDEIKTDPRLENKKDYEIERAVFTLVNFSREAKDNISFLRKTRNQVQHLKPVLEGEQFLNSKREELILVAYLAVACQVKSILNDLADSDEG